MTTTAAPDQTIEGRFPVSANQERQLVLEDWSARFSSQYLGLHLTLTMQFTAEPEIDRLEGALNQVIAQHAILRSSFVATAGRSFAQVIHAHAALSIGRSDATGHAPATRREALQSLVGSLVNAPFDYRRPPLIRGTLVRLADDNYVLLLVVHHLVSDQASMRILRSEIDAFYTGKQPAPEAAPQFHDFVSWQRQELESGGFDEGLAYWQAQWSAFGPNRIGYRDLDLPRPSDAAPCVRGSAASLILDAGTSQGLRAFAAGARVTWFVLFLAATSIVLHRLTGRSQLAVWTNFANREQASAHRLVGWVANAHIIGISVAGDPTGRDLLDQVRQTVAAAQRNQGVPCPVVRHRLGQPDCFSDAAIFFDLTRDWARGEVALADGIAARQRVLHSDPPSVDLRLHVHDVRRHFAVRARYPVNRFSPQSMQGLVDEVAAVAVALAAGSHRPVSVLARSGPSIAIMAMRSETAEENHAQSIR